MTETKRTSILLSIDVYNKLVILSAESKATKNKQSMQSLIENACREKYNIPKKE